MPVLIPGALGPFPQADREAVWGVGNRPPDQCRRVTVFGAVEPHDDGSSIGWPQTGAFEHFVCDGIEKAVSALGGLVEPVPAVIALGFGRVVELGDDPVDIRPGSSGAVDVLEAGAELGVVINVDVGRRLTVIPQQARHLLAPRRGVDGLSDGVLTGCVHGRGDHEPAVGDPALDDVAGDGRIEAVELWRRPQMDLVGHYERLFAAVLRFGRRRNRLNRATIREIDPG